jgi:hypothetical protein
MLMEKKGNARVDKNSQINYIVDHSVSKKIEKDNWNHVVLRDNAPKVFDNTGAITKIQAFMKRCVMKMKMERLWALVKTVKMIKKDRKIYDMEIWTRT